MVNNLVILQYTGFDQLSSQRVSHSGHLILTPFHELGSCSYSFVFLVSSFPEVMFSHCDIDLVIFLDWFFVKAWYSLRQNVLYSRVLLSPVCKQYCTRSDMTRSQQRFRSWLCQMNSSHVTESCFQNPNFSIYNEQSKYHWSKKFALGAWLAQ